MNWLLRLLISTIAVLVASYLLPGVSVNGPVTALVVAVVLSLLNLLLRPILIILSLPVTILTLGLFLLVINALMVYLTDELIDGFTLRNFWWALWFSIVISLIQSILESMAGSSEKKRSAKK